MAQNIQKLKNRISSIKSTIKITSAMELIANVKLKKQRDLMENNKEYSKILLATVNSILKSSKNIENKYLKENKSTSKLTFIFSSDMGLCGGYNTNMLRMAYDTLNVNDPIILIGTKQRKALLNKNYRILNESCLSDNISLSDIKKLVNIALDRYLKEEIGGIQVLYTEFTNTVTFTPKIKNILPSGEYDEGEVSLSEVEFEPGPDEILDNLIPMMVNNVVYSLYLESKTAEQANRRLAMENATNNGEDLSENLLLKFNQARQASITQEITEIVSGADAL